MAEEVAGERPINDENPVGKYFAEKIRAARESDKKFVNREAFWRAFIKEDPDLAASMMTMFEKTNLEDHLTGLLNRAGFVKEAEGMIGILRKLEIPDDYKFVIVYGDADGLKQTNDTEEYGRDVGDSLLVQIGEAFKSSISMGLVAKPGPDEFALLTLVKSPKEVETIANKIQSKMEKHRSDGEMPPWGGVTLGVVEIKEGEGIEALLNKADTYMKVAKNLKTSTPGERGGHVGGLQHIN